MNISEELSKPLNKEDIELRVGHISAKGLTLLVYKTARTDVKRLNSVCGTSWKNQHFYDNKGLLCCKIAVFDKDIKEWVSREDVGTESMTEKEKGSYSDSFKRAGFRWGIGLELYNAPFIFIQWDTKLKDGQKHKYDSLYFYDSKLAIEDYQVVDGVVKISISYKDKGIVYSNIGNKAPTPNNTPTVAVKQYSINDILELAKVKDFDISKIETAYKKTIDTFNLAELNKAFLHLQKK